MKPLLFIALDDLAEKEKDTLDIVENFNSLRGNFGYKVNLDYLLNPSKNLKECIATISGFGRPLFADLKMWNGTRTMVTIVKNLVKLNVDYLNVYALAEKLLPKVIEETKGTQTKVLGLTILTHYNDEYCANMFNSTLVEMVKYLSEIAIESGCHGVIVPGTMLDVVDEFDIIKVVPGVRPKWYKDDRHEEEIEPKLAIEKGANILVCGSPIMKVVNQSRGALDRILKEMS